MTSHFGSVLFRDLKPSNIGISREGSPLIFDFGLARELKPKDSVDGEGNYKLTKMVGTLRYVHILGNVSMSQLRIFQAFIVSSSLFVDIWLQKSTDVSHTVYPPMCIVFHCFSMRFWLSKSLFIEFILCDFDALYLKSRNDQR